MGRCGRSTIAAAGAAAVLFGAVSPSGAVSVAANPIRKVVTMLQNMQTKVAEEGKKEEKLYEEFMCYCKNSRSDLDQSIEAAKAKIEAGAAAVKEAAELKKQLESDLKTHKADRDEAKSAIAETKALREKEGNAYSKYKTEAETNIAAIKKAVAALEKGAGSSFLQSASSGLIRSFAMEKADLPDASRQEVLAFLAGSSSDGYAPASGEITGILKQMGDEMKADLEDETKQEVTAQKNAEELLAAKGKEVETVQAQIEDKSARLGEIGVKVSEQINDVEDTKEALAADEKFVQELETGCKTKTAEWEEVKKTRAEEILALAETVKVLNDDDALDLFSKTLPGASSFLQLQVTAASQRARALDVVRRAAAGRHSPKLDFIALALNGKTAGFEKVIAMIDGMSENLQKEQTADDDKKAYCEAEFDKAEDKHKSLELSIKDSETAIDKMKGEIETLGQEIKALEEGIKALDKSVAEATTQRKEENLEYKELMSTDGTAKEVLGWAKNRLNKFYNPKLYVAPAKRELSEEERITVNNGGTLAPEVAGGIAGTGIGASLVQVRTHTQRGSAAPPPPPETFGPYTKKSEESGGVIAMIDLLTKDLDKEMQEAEVMEKDAQSDYSKMMDDASTKRAEDSKLLVEKSSAKANTEDALEDEENKKADTTKEAMNAAEYLSSLHGECDWLVQNYDARKGARTSEGEALVSAKAVLSGADYSLLQIGASRGRGFMAPRL